MPNKFRILILEDNPDDAALLQRKLRLVPADCVVTVVGNQQDFESELASPPDIILADYSLPSFNAVQALEIVRRRDLDIPVIIVTGTASLEQALHCVKLGASDYVFKDRLDRLPIALALAIHKKELATEKKQLALMQANFIQNVSHELRTPLGLIMGHAEMLADPDKDIQLGPLNELQATSLEVICRRAKQMERMVKDIMILMELDAKQLDGGYAALNDLSLINASETLLRILRDWEPTASAKKLTLISHVQSNIRLTSSNRLLDSLMDNLISNAFKFTQRGSVTISLRVVGDSVEFQVSDTGIGIKPESMDMIFNRFIQINGSATRPYGGTGLGLAVVREVAASLGGKISVKSAPGIGTIFTFLLPMEET